MENQLIKNYPNPGNWVLYYNDDGIPYWHDHISGESVWASTEDVNKQAFLETSNISATNYYNNNNDRKNNIQGNEEDDDNEDDDDGDDDDGEMDETFEKSFNAFLSTSEGRDALENELARLEKEFSNRMQKSINKITKNRVSNMNDSNDVEFGDNDDDNDNEEDETYSIDSISTEDSDVQEIMEPLMVVPKWIPYYPTIMKKINGYTTHFTMINGAKEILSSSSNVTTTELVVNTSASCVSTSSRVINGTKYLVSRLMSVLFSLLGTFFSLIWSKIDNIIKTQILTVDKKKKSKKHRKENIVDDL